MVAALSDANSIGFRVSKSSEVLPSELVLVGAETGIAPRYGEQMLLSKTDPQTALEVSGTKISQRSEFIETDTSDDVNVAGSTIYYAFSIYIDPVTQAPTPISGGPEANVALFQFHQRNETGASDRPAMQIELDAHGNIVAEFGDAIGKRAYTLVDGGMGGADAIGQWIDIVIGVKWLADDTGWMTFHVREEGETDYTLEVLDTGQNTSTGHVYLKYGIYRNFLERDPALQDSVTLAYYDGLRRADTFAEAAAPPQEGPVAGTDFNDTLIGGSESEFLIGNAGDDLILGGGGADRIEGGSGDDDLSGQNGDDVLIGGKGDDTALGGKGSDWIDGGAGQDRLGGGSGKDMLIGGTGDDTLLGGGGGDTLIGGDGDDAVFGDNGRDWLEGGAGNDTLDGGKGRDTLIGGDGADALSGERGKDTLIGGQGPDTLTGGAGHDVFIFKNLAEAAGDTVTDYTRGDRERDRIDLTALDLLPGFGSKAAWANENLRYDAAERAVIVDLGDWTKLRIEDHDDIGAGFESDVYSGLLL